jgi:hypothetical protein
LHLLVQVCFSILHHQYWFLLCLPWSIFYSKNSWLRMLRRCPLQQEKRLSLKFTYKPIGKQGASIMIGIDGLRLQSSKDQHLFWHIFSNIPESMCFHPVLMLKNKHHIFANIFPSPCYSHGPVKTPGPVLSFTGRLSNPWGNVQASFCLLIFIIALIHWWLRGRSWIRKRQQTSGR